MTALETSLAEKSDAGDVFIREVDDEYRRERMGALWARWGRWLIVGIGVLLIAVAGLLYWRDARVKATEARGARFGQALAELRAGQTEKAAPTLTELAGAREPGYRALARLAQAAVLVEKRDEAGALRLLDAIVADGDAAQPFRDLALLKATGLRFDTLAPGEVVARLRPLAQPGNPWFGSAAELTALAYLKDGKPALARPLLDAVVKDVTVPVSIRGRVQQLVTGLPAAPAPGGSAR